jgi:hypothetical protein
MVYRAIVPATALGIPPAEKLAVTPIAFSRPPTGKPKAFPSAPAGVLRIQPSGLGRSVPCPFRRSGRVCAVQLVQLLEPR